MKFWSISTTVRNPERIRSFLSVLKEMEGELWNENTQKKYQILLIKNKVYGYGEPQFHNSLPEEYNKWLEGEITYEQAEKILNYKNYKGGGAMRGRQSFNPIKKMGLAFVNDENKIEITDFGKYFLREDYDLGEVFFKSFLKWQYPNPYATKYKNGYNIKPFIATLHLINLVNKLAKEKSMPVKGVSKVEFALFFVSLSNYKDISKRAKEIIKFRIQYEKLKDDEKQKEYLESFFNKRFPAYESLSNAFDYADNIIRYFRLTRYIYIRGGGWYIDVEPRRNIEIESLLESDNASAIRFSSKKEYIKYLGNINVPVLPWETPEKIKKIIQLLEKDIEDKIYELIEKQIPNVPKKPLINIDLNDIKLLKNKAEELRVFRRKLFDLELHYQSQNLDKIEEYIERLENIFKLSKNRPVELEKLITLSLNALNDALEIKPNYPTGDDNEPTFTAPANKPDIECYYHSFNAICEVTLLTNRTQWFNEGQPVMRHIRDFEEKHKEKETYCLFIAPKLHRDTINTFWFAVKYEYEGIPQKIVPMSITQFIELLKILKQIKEKGYFLTHLKIKELYDSIIKQTTLVKNSDEWINKIPKIIENWKNTLIVA